MRALVVEDGGRWVGHLSLSGGSECVQGILSMGTRFVPYLAYPAQACRQGALPELTNAHSLTRIILIVFIVRELV